MRQPISRAQHGIADYSYVALVAAAPKMAGFADDSVPTRLAHAFSGTTLAASALTRAEWGVARVLPFKAHLALDMGAGLLALAAPWLFGFSHNRAARNTFLAMGVTALVASSLTRPDEMPQQLD